MISCQVDMRFNQFGIDSVTTAKIQSENYSVPSVQVTIVKLDSESIFFYLLEKTIGEKLLNSFFSNGQFLIETDFFFTGELRFSLRLPENSIIPIGQYDYRNVGSHLIIKFDYCQTKDLTTQRSDKQTNTTEGRLRAA